jgi:Cdc6-like AAA superfamily ATPase
MSSLSQYKNSLNRWQIREIPFRATPPEDSEELIKVFYGREKIIESSIPALYEGRNVLIRGAWGIGKTALIKTLLYKLQKEVADLNEKMLVLYLGGVTGETTSDFYRAVLLSVASALAESGWDEEAENISNAIRGFTIQTSKTTTEGQVKLGIINLGRKTETPDNKVIPTVSANPYPLLMDLLHRAEETFGKVVIAIDDLDKKDTPIVQEILEGSLELFRASKRRAFIITGRAFTDLQEVNLQALGIFSESIKLDPISNDDLKQITINYLNIVRKQALITTDPFTDEVIDLIAEYSQGIPRQMNIICEQVMRQAALEGREKIDRIAFNSAWTKIQEQMTFNLTPYLRKLLYIAYQIGGISEDIDYGNLEKLGVSTFVELIPLLNSAEKAELITRVDTDSGFLYLPSKLFNPLLPPSPQDGA